MALVPEVPGPRGAVRPHHPGTHKTVTARESHGTVSEGLKGTRITLCISQLFPNTPPLPGTRINLDKTSPYGQFLEFKDNEPDHKNHYFTIKILSSYLFLYLEKFI